MQMKLHLALSLVLIAAASAAHAATSIYKCMKSDGSTVFSPAPCGANAKTVDTSRALMRGTAPNLQGVSDNAALSRIDGDCENRILAIGNRYHDEYAEVGREENRLRWELGASTNNIAGATRDNGIRSQLAAITQRRADLSIAERKEAADTRKQCDDDRRAELKRQADRDAATAITAPTP
jgi:hypothetical protein